MTALRKSPEVRDLQREAEAARSLIASLRTVTDDEEVIDNAVEGETNLHELIAAVMTLVTETQIQQAGLESMLLRLKDRKASLERREDGLRACIAQAMDIGGMKKLPLPEATLSLAARAPAAQVIDEILIPARFWKQPDPVLDRKALNAAIKDGEDIPGVTRSNGSVSLTIRRT
jgi:hypothetical protein